MRLRQDNWSTSSHDGEPQKKEPERSTGTSHDAENGSQSSDSGDDHLIDICGDIKLYEAAGNGNLDEFLRILQLVSAAEQAPAENVMRRVTPAGNTFLHVAAKHGQAEIVNYIASEDQSLVLKKNADGDTALHVAVKEGVEAMVKTLVSIHQTMIKSDTLDEDNLLRAKNEKGNMALHEALINRQESIALYLIQEDREAAACELNHEEESALYLAVRAGTLHCVTMLGDLLTDEKHKAKQFKGKSPFEAAIEAKNKLDVLKAMLDKYPSLIQLTDKEGRTALHYAASSSQLEVIQYLLEKYPPNATRRVRSTGYFPIHLASLNGYVDVIDLLLRDCPYPEELLDKERRNILHIATNNNKEGVVSYILETRALERLLNMKDKNGNTPLHLASIKMYYKIVLDLSWDKRVDVTLVNNKGMTALDATENEVGNASKLELAFIWAVLKGASTPRLGKISAKQRWNEVYSGQDYIKKVNTLMLVSTLVITVTFAAGFTVPGGYNSSGGDSGIATMLRDWAFQMFVFCNTIALYSSIIVTVTLLSWVHFGDLNLAPNAITLAVPLLSIALVMMCLAFLAGNVVAVSKVRWLNNVVLTMGIACLVVLMWLLWPLCLSFALRGWRLHFILVLTRFFREI